MLPSLWMRFFSFSCVEFVKTSSFIKCIMRNVLHRMGVVSESVMEVPWKATNFASGNEFSVSGD